MFVLITGINHPVLSLSPAPGTVQILLHFGGSVLLYPLLGTVYSLLHFGGSVLLSPLLLSPCTVHSLSLLPLSLYICPRSLDMGTPRAASMAGWKQDFMGQAGKYYRAKTLILIWACQYVPIVLLLLLWYLTDLVTPGLHYKHLCQWFNYWVPFSSVSSKP